MMRMTKSELVEAIAKKRPTMPAAAVERAVNTAFDSTADDSRRGGRVGLRGFGTFSVPRRRARQGRHPKPGVSFAVPPKSVPFFVIGHERRERVNDGRLKHPFARRGAALRSSNGQSA
jgi:integration host factor subunit beta